MFAWVSRSIRLKFMMVVVGTTFAALLFTAIVLVLYDVQNYQRAWVNDLMTQAEIIGRASAPALQFDDPQTAHINLSLLRVRPQISTAAIYTARGSLFASYARDDVAAPRFPPRPGHEGSRVENGEVVVVKRIASQDEVLGTVYVRARYDLVNRLRSYLTIVIGVMIVALAVAALMSYLLQNAITKPVLAITDVARRVKAGRDFGLRVEKTTDDEVGYLVDAFNEMLAEAGRRTEDLEKTNRSLEHEMSVRQQAESALRAADVKKDEFLATLAHELRNPMAPLRNALEIIRASNDTATVRSAQDIMDRQLRQLVRLVDDLLDVSRITTGKLMLKRERVALSTVTQSALDAAEPIIRMRGLELSVSLPRDPVTLDVDATRLAQVFTNLLNNAAKFTERDGRLTFTVERRDGGIEATVTDTGIGIAPESMPAIFDMFAQLDHSLERMHAGLGVGLSLAKRLTALHGGTLEGFSKGVGHGSRFVVRLPGVEVSDAAPSRDGASHGDPGAHRRILLADDNRDFVESFAVLLRAMGHEVCVTYDGGDALNAASTFALEIAFLDIGLPGMNGYELARRLRSMSATKDVMLIAVTGWGQDHDKLRARAAGFDHHLVKPITVDQVRAILAADPPIAKG